MFGSMRSMMASVAVISVLTVPGLALAESPLLNPELALAEAPAAAALSADELAGLSGGEDKANETIVAAISTAEATNNNNSIATGGGAYKSGDVTFGPGALTNFNGINNMVINTGANNNVIGNISVSIATVAP